MDKIIEGVYLGDIRAAANLFLLKKQVSIRVLILKRALHMCCRFFKV
jgi:hypothetical protein